MHMYVYNKEIPSASSLGSELKMSVGTYLGSYIYIMQINAVIYLTYMKAAVFRGRTYPRSNTTKTNRTCRLFRTELDESVRTNATKTNRTCRLIRTKLDESVRTNATKTNRTCRLFRTKLDESVRTNVTAPMHL
jgi:hypothetical protein